MFRLVLGISVVATSLVACGSSEGSPALESPLDIDQALSQADIPCDDQSLEKFSNSKESAGFSEVTLQFTDYSVLSCEATGGGYQIAIVSEPDVRDALLRTECLRQVIASVEIEAPVQDTEWAIGERWIAQSAPGSIVTNGDLADALNGEVSNSDELCQPFTAEMTDARAQEESAKEAQELAQREREQREALAGDLDLQMALARDETASAEVLEELAAVGEVAALCRLVSNPAATSEVYESLLERSRNTVSIGPRLRFCLANSSETPAEILRDIIDGGDPGYITRAARRNLG